MVLLEYVFSDAVYFNLREREQAELVIPGIGEEVGADVPAYDVEPTVGLEGELDAFFVAQGAIRN